MDYNLGIKKFDEQKKEDNLSDKLFKYNGLVQAIEFFSQKLNFEQIIDAAFGFVNELLEIEKSAIFILQGSSFVLKKLKGYESAIVHIKNCSELQNIAILHGTLLYSRRLLLRYFDESVLEAYSVNAVIPLIIENNLYGFIFISKEPSGELSGDEYIISESLMKLFNNALEGYKRYEELQRVNRDLDEKVFNLFAINQSSKALLSELSLELLYNLSVDVFAELTQSSSTGFILYDEHSESFKLKAYKDTLNQGVTFDISLTFNKAARMDPNRIILDISNDLDIMYFNNIFVEGIEQIRQLQSSFLVLLVKNTKLLGFVSLGQTVTGYGYKKSVFELIDSLASATYTALSNAYLFKQVYDQKKLLKSKLDKLVSLNRLMRNINSSESVDTLIELTLKTMNIAFGVEKVIIGLYDKDKEIFNISGTIGFETSVSELKVTSCWKRIFEGDTVYEATAKGVEKYIGTTLLKDIEPVSGILIVPICMDRAEIDMIGAMFIFKYARTQIFDEENLVSMETIAGHIAPVLDNLYTIREQSRLLLPNYIDNFKRDFETEVRDALEFSISLRVVQVEDCESTIFRESKLANRLKPHFNKIYPVTSGNVFIIIYDEDCTEEYIKEVIGMNNVKVRIMRMGKDFYSYEGFFELFASKV